MSQTWQLQEAKNKFSRVVQEALDGEPQIITRRGVEAVVVLSITEYQKMVASRGRLSDFFRRSPLVGVELDLERDQSDVRLDVEL
jgi:prevent-host-death family protein